MSGYGNNVSVLVMNVGSVDNCFYIPESYDEPKCAQACRETSLQEHTGLPVHCESITV